MTRLLVATIAGPTGTPREGVYGAAIGKHIDNFTIMDGSIDSSLRVFVVRMMGL